MSDVDPSLARLQRLLEGCRKGVSHDLANQMVVLLGLLQLLQQDEAQRLSPAGRDYVRRLLGAARRTQDLARTLKDLTGLAGPAPPARPVAIAELVQEVLQEMPDLSSTFEWQAPRVLAPRPLLIQAVAQAVRLLVETAGRARPELDFRSLPAPAGVELTINVRSLPAAPSPALPPLRPPAQLPGAWHERLECLLLRELAAACGGAVIWRTADAGPSLGLSLPAPR
jgi:signal transduction histidine kinase